MKRPRRGFLMLLVLISALTGLTGCNAPQRDLPNGDSPSSTPRSPVRPTPVRATP